MPNSTRKTVDFAKLLAHEGRIATFERGETIFQVASPSDTVYLVKKGLVKLAYLDQSGRKFTSTMVDVGGIFGEMCLVGEEHHRHLAIAVEEAVVCCLSRATCIGALENDLPFLQAMLTHLAYRLQECEDTLEDLAFRDIQARLSRRLLKLSTQYGVKTKHGTVIRLQLTHKELADMIGSARENTTLVLNRFQREGILDKSRFRIVIKDEEELREKCGMVAN